MSTHRTTISDWSGHSETPEWFNRFGGHFRKALTSFKTAQEAAHDYERFAHRVPHDDASHMVYEKHFANSVRFTH